MYAKENMTKAKMIITIDDKINWFENRFNDIYDKWNENCESTVEEKQQASKDLQMMNTLRDRIKILENIKLDLELV